jgi:hypothetical protein
MFPIAAIPAEITTPKPDKSLKGLAGLVWDCLEIGGSSAATVFSCLISD